MTVTGDVDAPARYTRADLAGMPQVTLPDERPASGTGPHTLTGVPLESLVLASAPRLPEEKNATLRVIARVTGQRHSTVAVALGELDAGFGNHPALLVLARDGRPLRHGPTLAFPGDTNRGRTVPRVSRIAIAVAVPSLPGTSTPGALQIRDDDSRTVTLSASRLAALPSETRTVTFQAGTEVQTHTETGPRLSAVLRAAHVRPRRGTAVAALGEDGYVAAVTPGEASSGGRPLQISLVEDGVALAAPRLVVDGDVRGGRYVSDLVALVVSGAHR